MKILQMLWIVFLCSWLNCGATSKGYPKMSTASFLEGSLRGKLSNQPLPSSWDEIEPVVEMRKMDPRGSLYTMRTINSFALVPGAPVILEEPGISHEYYGKRLFLISRSEEPAPSRSPGRCVILIDPEGTDSNTKRTYSYFIPEATAQLILRQLKGFDPKTTSVAFDNLPAIEKRFKDEKQVMDDFVKTQQPISNQSPRPQLENKTRQPNSENGLHSMGFQSWVIWIAGGMAAGGVLVLAWLVRRYLRRC